MSTAQAETEASREVVSGMYEAALSGDIEGLLAAVADDVVILEPSFLPYGGEYRGKEGIAGVFGEVAKVLDPSGMRLEHLVAEGDKVYAKVTVPERSSGEDVVLVEESTVRDGEIVEVRIYFHESQGLHRHDRAA